MADYMTKEEEQKLLAAAESGDVSAMDELSNGYYQLAYRKKILFNKKSYKEKYEYWRKKTAEAGHLKSIQHMNFSLATLHPSEADHWAEVYYRTLDLLLRKYKAIYCDEDRKEEARSILAAISERTDGPLFIRYRGKYEDTKEIGARLLAGIKDDPRYRDDYEASHRPIGTGTDMDRFRHFDMYTTFDYEHYASDENYYKYAVIRPDQLDAFEKEVEELERTLPQREADAKNHRLNKFADPQQELFGFTVDDGWGNLSDHRCFIPRDRVVDVVEEYRFLPHIPVAYDNSDFIECSIRTKNGRAFPVINIAGYLDFHPDKLPFCVEKPGPMIIIKALDVDYLQDYSGDFFAIPTTSVIGPVDYSGKNIYIRKKQNKYPGHTEFVVTGKWKDDLGLSEYDQEYEVLINIDKLVQDLDLRGCLELVPSYIQGESAEVQKRFSAFFALRDKGFPPFERGVMIINRAWFNSDTKTVAISGRVAHGKITKNSDLVFYDMVSEKESEVFHVDELNCNGTVLSEAGVGTPVYLITDNKDRSYPSDWKTLRQVLVKVKS